MTDIGEILDRQSQNCFDYLRDYRLDFWSEDFLSLMAQRWGIESAGSFLEVGCGRGHWIISLLPQLGSKVVVWGIDREEYAVQSAIRLIRQHFRRLHEDNLHIVRGDGNCLPFPPESFDVVACQTYLMHQQRPDTSIQEMVRVLKPGGTLICAEPNNILNYIADDAVFLSVEERVAEFEFWLRHQRGKERLGKGCNGIGPRLHELLKQAALVKVQTYISDKVCGFGEEELAPATACAELQDLLDKEIGLFDRGTLHRFVKAGGGSESLFEKGLTVWRKHVQWMIDNRRLDQYLRTPGSLYLSSGQKR